jgi:hypothetical protein
VSGLLLIHGGDEFARTVYARERRAYWTQALPFVLEKHGFVHVTVAGPDALEDDELQRRHAAVLVGRLPEGAWSPLATERTLGGQALLEGPLPAHVAERLGLTEGRAVPPDGSVRVVDKQLAALAASYGTGGGGRAYGPRVKDSTDRDPDLHWSEIASVPISREQAEAWLAPALDVVAWETAPHLETLATWLGENGDRCPAVVRSGSTIATSLSLFAYLGRHHTSPPWPREADLISFRTIGLEVMLLGLIDLMFARSGSARARILPWPRGVRWVRSIRHDFDRPLSAESLDAALAAHRRLGSAATWYWRSCPRVGRELPSVLPDQQALRQAALVAAQPHHEVAIHVERPWLGGAGEREIVEAAVGGPVFGSSAHGGPRCFRYQGAPSLLWAEAQGLRYTELLEHFHLHPHRFANLTAAGEVRPLKLVVLPHHASFDAPVPGSTYADTVRETIKLFRAVGGFGQIMNHPDINFEQLIEFLAETEADGMRDWTAHEAVDWWSRTHSTEQLRLEDAPGGGWLVASRTGVEDLGIELLLPDGSRIERHVTIPAGGEVIVASPH